MVQLEVGDITLARVDAIVNAANEAMLGGGGVDGAIHRAAGPELLAACRACPEVRPGVRCPTGEARITPAFNLPARYVIHTVGPVYTARSTKRDGSPGEAATDDPGPLLASAYRSCLRLAQENRLKSIAFPAISCGVYGYPLEDAARIALAECAAVPAELAIRFVLFSAEVYEAWANVRRALEQK